MNQLDLNLENQENKLSREFILEKAGNPEIHRTNVRLFTKLFKEATDSDDIT